MSEEIEGAEEVAEPVVEDPPKPRRGRPPKVREEETPAKDETPTMVVCIVTTQPWTESGKLKHGEKAEVPKWIADLLEEKGLATIV